MSMCCNYWTIIAHLEPARCSGGGALNDRQPRRPSRTAASCACRSFGARAARDQRRRARAAGTRASAWWVACRGSTRPESRAWTPPAAAACPQQPSVRTRVYVGKTITKEGMRSGGVDAYIEFGAIDEVGLESLAKLLRLGQLKDGEIIDYIIDKHWKITALQKKTYLFLLLNFNSGEKPFRVSRVSNGDWSILKYYNKNENCLLEYNT